MNKDWLNIILEAIYKASDVILEVYAGDFHIHIKDDRSPVTIADTQSSIILVDALKKTNIMVISEEEEKPGYDKRKKENRIWLVDPLDGTKEFIHKNDEFCINIALIEDHKPVFGLIADPIKRKIIFGNKNMGVYYMDYHDKNPFREENHISKQNLKKPYGLVYSRSHFSPRISSLFNWLENEYGNIKIIKKGSALKFFDLAMNRAVFYPRMAPTMEWDIAAGQAIFEALGGEVLDFTNFEPLRYNKQSLYNPHFIAKRKELSIPKEK